MLVIQHFGAWLFFFSQKPLLQKFQNGDMPLGSPVNDVPWSQQCITHLADHDNDDTMHYHKRQLEDNKPL